MPELIDSPHYLMRLSQRIFDTPLMIAENELDLIIAVLGERVGLPVFAYPDTQARMEMAARRASRNTDTKTTAVISITGPLVHKRAPGAVSGGPTMYSEIWQQMSEADRNPDVSAIMMDIHSGGGEVAGAFATADKIRTLSKPVYAYVNESAFSAAYLLASSAQKIWMPETGAAGSIGVIARHRNEVGKNQQEGVEYTDVTYGAKKNDFATHKPLSESARAELQSKVDEVGMLFDSVVARNRNTTPEAIRGLQAGIFQGKAAVRVGLVDEILTFDQALQRTFESEGAQEMSKEEMAKIEARLAALEEENKRLKAEQTLSGGEIITGTLEVKSDLRYDILMACLAAGDKLPEKPEKFAEKLTAAGVSLEEAQSRIIKAMSENQSQEHIRSSHDANKNGGEDQMKTALFAECKRRAEAARVEVR